MSSPHYSKAELNTYDTTPYFEAFCPEGYDWRFVASKVHRFLLMPPTFRELCRRSKIWAMANWPVLINMMKQYYDDDGYELFPGTNKRLTDSEVNAQWPPLTQDLVDLQVEDIDEPEDGFPDAGNWQPPARLTDEDEDEDEEDRITKGQLMEDIKSRGIGYVAKYYNISTQEFSEFKMVSEAAQHILECVAERHRQSREPATNAAGTPIP